MSATTKSLPPSSQSLERLLSASLSSASSLVILQFFSRLFTFALNQALVRLASPQTFGTAAIQFELLLSTILFLCREGVRNALLRAPPSQTPSRDDIASKSFSKATSDDLIMNLSILPVLFGIPIGVLAALLYISSSSSITTSQPHFHVSVVIYAVASFLELASEPLYIRAQNQMRFDLRVQAEGSAVVTKTLVTVAMLVAAPSDWALVSFATGQATYGLAMLTTYWHAYGTASRFLLKKVSVSSHGKEDAYFDAELLHLAGAMTRQSVVKHFLTEGDKFLVSHLSPLADQGGYALASNYGSLVARIIFQPIEEMSRVFFSKSLSASSSNSKDSLNTASQILLSLLLLFTHLFLLLVTFGPPYLSLVLSILLPPRYHNTSAPLVLRAYIYYVPTMAFNGLLEAFLASTSTPSELRTQSRWMFLFSVAFVVTAVWFTKGLGWGDAGLVWANVANLGFRALYAWLFARRFFNQRGAGDTVKWRKALPPMVVLSAFALSAATTRWSANSYHDLPIFSQVGHVALGAACLVGCLIVCFVFERATFYTLLSVIRGNK